MQSIPDKIKAISKAYDIWTDWELNRYVPLAHLEQSYNLYRYDGDTPDQEQIIEMMWDDMIEEFNIHPDAVEAYWYGAVDKDNIPTWDDWDTATLGYWGYE